MFKTITLPAVLSGVMAALLLTLVQQLWVTPLILQAETYETAAEALPHQHTAEQLHEENAWQPENGWQRTLTTASGNTVLAIGFALLLTGFYSFYPPLTVRYGMAWGLAGYAVFFVAPSLGLPPELPATAAAELLTRQYWWLATVFATAIGLGLLFLQTNKILRVVGLVLLAIPHIIGAPQPEVPSSLSPEELQNQFRYATAWTNALFWLLLGVLSAVLFKHFSDADNG
jgi:cobalt transporter subunit CbtA